MEHEKQIVTAPPQALSTGDLIAGVIQTGITPDNVSVIERLCELREREAKSQAERDFSSAFAQLQADMPSVNANKVVPGNNGEARYRYAPYEEIMATVRPILKRHNFAITFDTEVQDGRVVVTCTLIHACGHSRSNKFACRIGKGPPASSEAQGDGAATTYAKRFALCAALNIVIEHDTDARAEGSDVVITQEQADQLRDLCDDMEADRAKFLKYAGVENFEDIQADRLEMLREALINRKKK